VREHNELRVGYTGRSGKMVDEQVRWIDGCFLGRESAQLDRI
jgi:hypothetical protein